jgi:hypothetical protein
LWRDRIAIALYPDRVVWLRAGKGLHTRIAAKGRVPCEAGKGASWRGALAVLPHVLQDAGAAGAQVSVLLSNRLMRYAITPNPDSANSREELDVLTRHAFERTHGEATQRWEIRLSDAAPGRSALASAVDSELLALLREAVTASGGQLTSIQPYLMAALNRLGKKTSSGSGIFVVVEPERLCQLAWHDGGWCTVQQAHAVNGWTTTLGGMLDRVTMNTELQDMRAVQLCTPEIAGQANLGGHWQVDVAMPSWPDGLSPINDQAYAGAMLVLR